MEPHNLRNLLLNSLRNILKMEPIHNYQNVKVYTEETTEDGKRIDITILGNDFVIVIENKIFANLDNPLESYRKYIEDKYSSKSDKRYVVLSVNKITNPEGSGKIKNNNYKNVTYEEFFESVKNNMGHYLIGCDQTYLTFLLDFMRTIENNYIYINTEMNHLFLENKKDIDELVKRYEDFNKNLFKKRERYIDQIIKMTDNKYNVYGDNFNISFESDPKIGIECTFDDNLTTSNPIGNLKINITTWESEKFGSYEPEVKKIFNKSPISEGKRAFLYWHTIENPENDDKQKEIVDLLNDGYNKLKNIIDCKK